MSTRYRALAFIMAGALLLAAGSSSAAVPTRMTFQGKLTNAAGDPVPAGLKSFTFKIYDSPVGGTEIWPAGPGEVQPLSTDDDGLWTAEVGALVPLNEDVFTSDSRWLEVTVDDGVSPAETLTRVKLNTSPYTFQSEQSINAVNAEHAGDADSLGGLPPSAFAATGHSHDASTLINEPGFASATAYGSITLTQGTTTMTDVIACTLTTPTAGYVYVQGRTTARTQGTTGINIAWFQIDETAGGDVIYPHWVEFGGSGVASQIYRPIFVDRAYFKPAGTYVFRLEARAYEANGAGAVTDAFGHRITAWYYPSAYGTVAE